MIRAAVVALVIALGAVPAGAQARVARFALTLGGPQPEVVLVVGVQPARHRLRITGVAVPPSHVFFCGFTVVRQGDVEVPVLPRHEDSCGPCPGPTCTATARHPWRTTLRVPVAIRLREPFVLRWHGIALAVD